MILDAQQELSALVQCHVTGQHRRIGMTQMQWAGRGRRETSDESHVFSTYIYVRFQVHSRAGEAHIRESKRAAPISSQSFRREV